MKLFYSTPDHNGQTLEIHIEFNPESGQVEAITGVYIRTPHMVMSVSELLINNVNEMCEAINNIINRVNWQSVYEKHQRES